MRRAHAPDVGVLVADPRILRHHAQLALQDDVETDADREAVDRGDQRLFEVDVLRLSAAAPMEQRIVRVLVRRALALRLVLAPGT